MDAWTLQQVFRLVHTAVEYIKGEGALCPVCSFFQLGRFRLFVTSTPGDGLRYAKCAHCGFTFKTVERLPEPIFVVTKTETLAVSATATYSKGRKRRRK